MYAKPTYLGPIILIHKTAEKSDRVDLGLLEASNGRFHSEESEEYIRATHLGFACSPRQVMIRPQSVYMPNFTQTR